MYYTQGLISTWFRYCRRWDVVLVSWWHLDFELILKWVKTFGHLEWSECILLVGGTWISMAPRLNCGRKKSDPCRCLMKVWNRCICCVIWQKKRKTVGWLKIADQLTLSYRVYSWWSKCAQWYHEVLLMRKMEAEESVSEWYTKRKTQMVTVAFENERGPVAKECGQLLI